MSPFSQFLHDIRIKRGLRQMELAELIGYEQSYVSALEVGLKGPPTAEFSERLILALALTDTEQDELLSACNASHRKLIIAPDAPSDIFWLLTDLRNQVERLSPQQIKVMREVMAMREGLLHEPYNDRPRLKRKRKAEAIM